MNDEAATAVVESPASLEELQLQLATDDERVPLAELLERSDLLPIESDGEDPPEPVGGSLDVLEGDLLGARDVGFLRGTLGQCDEVAQDSSRCLGEGSLATSM